MARPAAAAGMTSALGFSVQNLTNHADYLGYSGLMTSPFFRKPTMVEGVRTMNLGLSLSF